MESTSCFPGTSNDDDHHHDHAHESSSAVVSTTSDTPGQEKREKTLTIVGGVLQEYHVANMKREILLWAESIIQNSPANFANGSDSSSQSTNCGSSSSIVSTDNTTTTKTKHSKEYRIRLHAEENDGVSMWMTIKRARQLICRGVRIRVVGYLQNLDHAEIAVDGSNIVNKNHPAQETNNT